MPVTKIFFFLLSLFLLSSFFIPTNIELVGYSDKTPVFYSFNDKKTYVLQGDLFTEYYPQQDKGYVISANGPYTLSLEEKDTKSSYVLFDGHKREVFDNLDATIYAIVDSSGCIFYLDKNFILKSPNFPLLENIRVIGILFAENGYLYYCVDKEEQVEPDATLYKYNLSTGAKESFGERFFSEQFVYIKGKEQFWGQRLIDGKFRPVLFNFKTKKQSTFDLDEQKKIEKYTTIFYDPQKQYLCGISKTGNIEIIKDFRK
jgi:hypothetical protein